jgi:hypothetical protein
VLHICLRNEHPTHGFLQGVRVSGWDFRAFIGLSVTKWLDEHWSLCGVVSPLHWTHSLWQSCSSLHRHACQSYNPQNPFKDIQQWHQLCNISVTYCASSTAIGC